MWHLAIPSEDTLKWYKGEFLDPIVNSIREVIDNDDIKQILLPNDKPDRIEKLLIYPPNKLYPFCAWLENKIKEKVDSEDDLKVIYEQVSKAFDYNGRISRNKTNAYKLAHLIGTRTCVYCNRIYSFTIEDNNGESISRPDFDHWLPKEKHPLLSMSFFNLIPSCPICNRSIKLRNEFVYGEHVQPYSSSKDMEACFQYEPRPKRNWTLKLVGGTKQEKQTAKILKTEEVYQPYADGEVKDILDFAYYNPPQYLQELRELILRAYGGTISKEQAYRIAFGTELDSAFFPDRPLSKLKYDVLSQLQESLKISII